VLKIKKQCGSFWLLKTKAPALCDLPSTRQVISTRQGRLVAVVANCVRRQVAKYDVRGYETKPYNIISEVRNDKKTT